MGKSESHLLGVPRESYWGGTATGAEQEPTLLAQLEGRSTPMMVDTGATYTCVSPNNASHLPRSGKFTKTIGFSGQVQLIPMTVLVSLTAKNK